MNQVFLALIEFQPLPGSSLVEPTVAGGFVRAYVTAADNLDAVDKFKISFEHNRLKLIAVEWCVPVAETEWENEDDSEEDALVLSAASSKEVLYGDFHIWNPDSN